MLNLNQNEIKSIFGGAQTFTCKTSCNGEVVLEETIKITDAANSQQIIVDIDGNNMSLADLLNFAYQAKVAELIQSDVNDKIISKKYNLPCTSNCQAL